MTPQTLQEYVQEQLKILAVAMARTFASKGEKIPVCVSVKSKETGIVLIFAGEDIGDELVRHLNSLGNTRKSFFEMEKP